MENFNINLEKYIKGLNNKMKIEKKSKNTIEAYNRTYQSFLEFSKQYEKKLSFENIKEDDIYAFIFYKSDTMNKQGDISISSTNSIISHLKKLFKHIERNSDSLYDFDKVFDDIKLKQPNRVPKGLSEEEVCKLENHLEHMKLNETLLIFRNIILIKFMLYGALRATEATNIKLSDIIELDNEDLYKISFLGKGNKVSSTYIKKDLIEDELTTLVDVFNINQDMPIALTSTGKKMDRIQLSKMVNSIYVKAGLKRTGLHILRHTSAKRLINKGVPITVVQSLLNHSSIQTTGIYANPTENIIKKALIKI